MKNLYAALISTEQTNDIDISQITKQVVGIVLSCTSTTEGSIDTDQAMVDYCSEEEYNNIIGTCESEFNVALDDMTINDTVSDLVNTIVAQLTDSDSAESLQWNSRPFKQIIKQLDIYDKLLENLYKDNVSNEAVVSGILKVFIGVADVFIRCGNTLKTNLLKFNKSLKRSELRMFVESHYNQVKAVENNAVYTDVMNLQMARPTGLSVFFIQGIDYITKVYTAIDVKLLTDSFIKALIDIRRKMTRNEVSYKSDLDKLASTVEHIRKAVAEAIKKENNIFSSKSTAPTAPFKTLYASMEEFRQVRQKLSDIEFRLNDAKALSKNVDHLDGLLGDITQYLTEDTEVDKKFIESLSSIVRYMAESFDIYGICVMRQMSLEHNHVVNIEQIYKQ